MVLVQKLEGNQVSWRDLLIKVTLDVRETNDLAFRRDTLLYKLDAVCSSVLTWVSNIQSSCSSCMQIPVSS